MSDAAAAAAPPAAREPLCNFARFMKPRSIPPITCAAAHGRFLAVGTAAGSVHIFEVGGGGAEWRRINCHGGRINDICTDVFGEYIASAAEDGTVCVSAVHSDERTVHSHHRPVKATRLVPDFARQRERPLVTGGVNGKLYLLRKGWLFGPSMTEKLIHEGEGTIRAIAWRGPLVAWANDAGVKVYDTERDERVCYVEVPRPPAPPQPAAVGAPVAGTTTTSSSSGATGGDPYLTLLPVRLCWENDASLLIGWGTEVRVVTIREKPVAGGAMPGGAVAPAGPPPHGVAPAHGSGPAAPTPHAAAGPGGPLSSPTAGPSAVAGVSPAAHASAGPDAGPASGGPASGGPAAAPVVVRRAGEITLRHSTGDAFVVGVAPYGDDHIALLCYRLVAGTPAPPSGTGVAAPSAPVTRVCVELRLISREAAARTGSGTGGVGHAAMVYCERLPLQGLESSPAPASAAGPGGGGPPASGTPAPAPVITPPGDIHLVCSPGDLTGHDGLPLLFVASPVDVILASPRGPGDHVEWLVAAGRLEQAAAALHAHPNVVPPQRLLAVLDLYVKSLLEEGDGRKAAAACVRLMHHQTHAHASGGGALSSPGGADASAKWCEHWLQAVFSRLPPSSSLAAVTSDSAAASTPAAATAVLRALHFARAALVSTTLPTTDAAVARVIATVSSSSSSSCSTAATSHHALPLVSIEIADSEDDAAFDAGDDSAVDAAATAVRAAGAPGGDGDAVPAPPSAPQGVGFPPLSPVAYDRILELLLALHPPTFVRAARDLLASSASSRAARALLLSAGPDSTPQLFDAAKAAALVAARLQAVQGLPAFVAAAQVAGKEAEADASSVDAAAVLEAMLQATTLVGALARLHIACGRFEEALRLYITEHSQLSAVLAVAASRVPAAPAAAGSGGAPPRKGKVSRVLAAKAALAQRMDALGALEGDGPAAASASPPGDGESDSVTSAAPTATAATAVTLPAAARIEQRLARFARAIFALLPRHGLIAAVADRVETLLLLDTPRTLALIEAHVDAFPIDSVAMQLRERPELLLRVLDHLFTRKQDVYNTAAFEMFHGIQLQLYVQYDRTNLPAFLKGSKFYSNDLAKSLLLAATPAPLYRELVFVLTRAGEPKEAVAILLDNLHDVSGALALASSHGDGALWEQIVAHVNATCAAAGATADNSGEAFGALLDGVLNTPLNPSVIIGTIPDHVAIPRLRERLADAVKDRRIQQRLHETCNGLLQDDVMMLIRRQVSTQRRAITVSSDGTCALCNQLLSTMRVVEAPPVADATEEDGGGDGYGAEDGEEAAGARRALAAATPAPEPRVAVFFCMHSFHDHCLLEYRTKAEAAAAAARSSLRRRSRTGSMTDGSGRKRGGSFSLIGAADGGARGFGGVGGALAGAKGTPVRGGAGAAAAGGSASSGRTRRGSSSGHISVDGGGDDLLVAGGGAASGVSRCPLCMASGETVTGSAPA